MIQIQDPALNIAISGLDFEKRMRVNAKYVALLEQVSEKEVHKIERLIVAYIFQYMQTGNQVIDILLSNSIFINKISSMTDEQIEQYIMLSTQARLGFLLTNKILLKKYSTDDHIRICELHIRYQENPFLASIIEMASKHKAKVLYITKIVELLDSLKKADPYINDILLKDEFYLIKSDFERLIILDYMKRAESGYAKSLYKYFATNEVFIAHNDIYYLIDLVDNLMTLKNPKISDQLILEIKTTPSITSIYSPSELFDIMQETARRTSKYRKFFFNPFILANFSSSEVFYLYDVLLARGMMSIEELIDLLEKYKEAGLNPLEELRKKYNSEEVLEADISCTPINTGNTTLKYTISPDGEWIDA